MKRWTWLRLCSCMCVAAMSTALFAQQPAQTPTKPSTSPATKATTPGVNPTTPATTPSTKTATPETKATTPAPAANTATKSLYDRLGGEKAITAIANDFVDRAAKDAKVNFTRHGTPKEWKATPENVTALKHNVAQYLCMVTGGPQKYDGKDLKTAHQGMQITATEFDALTADLSASLDHAKVAKPEHDEMMKIVAGLKDQIVEQPSKTPAVTPAATSTGTNSKK